MTLQIVEQTKAQDELDAVLGPGVLPTLADRRRLPYFDALFSEILRLYTFGPIGKQFHYLRQPGSIISTQVYPMSRRKTSSTTGTSSQRDLFSSRTTGVFNSHGSIFSSTFTFSRAFFHDPKIYSDPETFSPDRFILSSSRETKEQDVRDFLFGFGRRCVPARACLTACVSIIIILLCSFRVCPGASLVSPSQLIRSSPCWN
jgi:hypothetical protein